MCDCNHDEVRSVTRLQNRALRTVNRLLRRRQDQIQNDTDKVVAALFEAPNESEAELALREIWENTGMVLECSPDDYPRIVELIVGRYDRLVARATPVQV